MIRQHANLITRPFGALISCGRIETGEVFEQDVRMEMEDGRTLDLRRITIRLDQATRDGDMELHLLTNLPKEMASAIEIADLYRKRWSIETAFQQLALWLNAELAPLGYPKAALFGFCVGLLSYNLLATVVASLKGVHGEEKVDEEVSGYLSANDVRMNAPGRDVVVEAEEWTARYGGLSAEEMAIVMLTLARHVDLRRLPEDPGEEDACPRTRFKGETHVSTKRLLDEARARKSRD
ncbi:MAG: transposase [Deltaproteobacteria bacterium]|nr:transposase [Deltaproteobacteria bacterium]